jgi:hypothetical protein
MCLTAEGGAVDVDGTAALLEPCLEAIAAGDGRELWQFEAAGTIQSAVGHKCLQAAGDSVSLSSCAHASSWELTASGQLKSGDNCLSQSGSFTGSEDAAASAPIQATSTADSENHGAKQAVDNDESSYWQSDPGSAGAQELTIDLGGARKLSAVEIVWEAPAESFMIQVSKDGASWSTVFSTDVNSLFVTKAYLGYTAGSKAKLVMKKPHPLYGSVAGKASYAVRRISFLAPRLASVVEPCATAAESTDARDKYFLSYVGQGGDPCPAKSLRAAVPSLDAARTSLAAATSKLANRVKNLGSCRSSFYARSLRGVENSSKETELALLSTAVSTETAVAATSSASPDTSAAVRQASGLVAPMVGTDGSADSQISAARGVVVMARGALAQR